jgi:hypothetical protein
MQPTSTLAGSPDGHEWFAADSLAIRGVALSSADCRLVGQDDNNMPCRTSGRKNIVEGRHVSAVGPAAPGNSKGTRPTSPLELYEAGVMANSCTRPYHHKYGVQPRS